MAPHQTLSIMDARGYGPAVWQLAWPPLRVPLAPSLASTVGIYHSFAGRLTAGSAHGAYPLYWCILDGFGAQLGHCNLQGSLSPYQHSQHIKILEMKVVHQARRPSDWPTFCGSDSGPGTTRTCIITIIPMCGVKHNYQSSHPSSP